MEIINWPAASILRLNLVGINFVKKKWNVDKMVFNFSVLFPLRLFLPLQPVSVETPQGGVYEGKRLSGQRVSLPFCFCSPGCY